MGFPRYTAGITREVLTRDCLQELRLWPGCETVAGLAVLVTGDGKFTVHVVEYGLAKEEQCGPRDPMYPAGEAAAFSSESRNMKNQG
jgi:hypothetical protein